MTAADARCRCGHIFSAHWNHPGRAYARACKRCLCTDYGTRLDQPADDECTCAHYVVDHSDPEPYHPENVDREDDPNCPIHRTPAPLSGTTPRDAEAAWWKWAEANGIHRTHPVIKPYWMAGWEARGKHE